MTPDLEARIAAHALLRGLVDASTFRAAAADPAGPVTHLLELGALDAEDVAVLEQLCAEGAEGSAAPAVPSPSEPGDAPTGLHAAKGVWDSLPRIGESRDGTGRQVLQALTLPAWRQYRNLRFVAEGGMGRVFRAWDPSLKRAVALKFLRRDDPDLLKRFVLEAQHQARVEHPHIGRVYEVGEWEGQAYIAMQFVKGETLEQAAPKLSLEDKARVMERVAEAVHAAHREGLIHRDLKPANILVETGEGDPRPVVVDFGLAKGLEPTGLTQQGLVIGTVHYMAPEQARGEHDQVGRRTDVYGLGATLHKVLTGQPPFAGAEGLDALRAALEDDAPSLQRLVPGLPEDLDLIVRTCLEKEPARRYESALAVAEDLRRWREGEPIRAQRPSLRYRTGKWARKHRLVMAVAGVALAALLGLAGYAGWLSWSAGARARYAQTFGQEAERIEALLRYAHLLPAHDIRAELDQARGRLRLLEAQAEQAGRLASGPAAYARGRAHLALGEPEAARPLLQQAWEGGLRTPEVALALGRVLGQVYQVELARARMLEVRDLREARIREVAEAYRKPALDLLRQGSVAALESPAYHGALMAFYEGRWAEAIRAARQAQAETPWFYEAQRLEGQVHLEQARGLLESGGGRDLLEAAARAFQGAQALAPSDPGLHLDEARTWGEVLRLSVGAGEDPRPDLTRVRASVAAARRLDSRDPAPPALLANALRAALRDARLPREFIQNLHAEHNALSAEALRLGPAHREALLARAGSLNDQASFANALGRARVDLLEEAQGLVQEGQRRYPEDPVFLVVAWNLAQRRMTLDMYRGVAPWASFETGLRVAERLRALRPRSEHSFQRVASLWVERAEYERTHGLDPEASVAAALEVLDEAQNLGLSHAALDRSRGDALLIRGQHRVRRGTQGRPDLEQACAAYHEAFRRNPGYLDPKQSEGEARIWMGREALNQGRSPMADLAEARRALAEGQADNADRFYGAFVGIQVDLMEARWRLVQGQDPGRGLREVQQRLDRLAARVDFAVLATTQAEAAAWAYRAWGRPADLRAGLAAAQRAAAKDAQAGEPQLWVALLRQEARLRGVAGFGDGGAQALEEALRRDRNLDVEARRLGLGR